MSADTYIAFAMWESRARDRMTPEELRDFDEAVQEFRFHIMAEGKVTGSDAVDESMREAINGRSVRDVLREGLDWELDRLEAERRQLEKSMGENALMRTRPGDTESANYLHDLRKRQEAHLQAVTGEIDLARKKLKSAAPRPSRPGDAPGPTPGR